MTNFSVGADGSNYDETKSLDPKITEYTLSVEMAEYLFDFSTLAADLLRVEPSDTSAEIVKKINDHVIELQRIKPDLNSWTEIALPLGALWGQKLVEELGWEWAHVVFHEYDDSEAIGVFSPDRSLAIYPLHFIYGCIENEAQVKILLSYNMLLDHTEIPELPAGSYENIMEKIQYIIPPDSFHKN